MANQMETAMRALWMVVLLAGCAEDDKRAAGSSEAPGKDTSAADTGSGTDTADTAADACDLDPEYDVTWEGWAGGFFATYCRSCHSITTPDRQGAPEGVDFDTQANVDRQLDAVWRVVLEDERMPVGGGVFPDDLLLLRHYLCSRED
jgi:hypothetical protein